MNSVLVFGAGAIGQCLAADLTRAGSRAVLVARPRFCEAIREHGLRVDDAVVRPEAYPDLAALAGQRFDWLVLTVKTFQVGQAVEQIAGSAVQLGGIVTMQNGLGTDRLVSWRFPDLPLLAATTTRAVSNPEPGHLVPEESGGMAMAVVNHAPQSVPEPFRPLSPQWCPDYRAMKWSKLLLNMVCNASCALLDWLPGQLVAHPGLYAAEVQAVREALRVMRREGLEPIDLPDYPVRKFSQAVRLPAFLSRPHMGPKIGRARGDKPPSFLLDLRSGRGVTEVAALNGAIVERGRRFGLDLPVNRVLSQRLEAVCRNEIPWERYRNRPNQLLQELRGS